MTKATRWLFLFCVVAVSAACAGDATVEEGEAAAGEVAETPPAASTDAQMQGFVNPNLASEAELAAAGLPAAGAAAIIEGRPFANMEQVDAVLAGLMDDSAREAVYASVWMPLNLNTASEAEILMIPGVGDRMAHEFDEYRPYAAMAEFDREIGKYVDEAEVARLAQYVFLPIDLNSATREEIMAIPGVGERMAHEFEEYRPYTNIEQFRREIGKYVDEDEVARLERYVTIQP